MANSIATPPPWTIQVPKPPGFVAMDTTDDSAMYQQYLSRGFCNMDETYKDLFDHGCYRSENLIYLIIGLGLAYGLLIVSGSTALAMMMVRDMADRGRREGKSWAQNLVVMSVVAVALSVLFFVGGAVFAIPAVVGYLLYCFWRCLHHDMNLFNQIGRGAKGCWEYLADCYSGKRSKSRATVKQQTLPISGSNMTIIPRQNLPAVDGFELQEIDVSLGLKKQ